MISQNITLRPVTEADDKFLLSVYASTRAEELARVPWTAEQKDAFVRMQFDAQSRHYSATHPQARHSVISADGIPVGRIYLDHNGNQFHILDITVLTEHHNRGIGSSVLRQVMDEAQKAGKPVTIYVENFNPSVRLFRRLGFETAEENGFHLLLKQSRP